MIMVNFLATISKCTIMSQDLFDLVALDACVKFIDSTMRMLSPRCTIFGIITLLVSKKMIRLYLFGSLDINEKIFLNKEHIWAERVTLR